MDEALTLVIIYFCVFGFLLILLGIGEFYGGDWQTVAQGVARFILIIVGFASACFILVKLLGRR